MISRDVRLLLGDVFDALEGASEQYAVTSAEEDARLMDWFQDHFPLTSWARLDWEAIDGHECAVWAEGWEAIEAFRALCERHTLGNPAVAIFWDNAILPVLTLPLAAVRQHAAHIFNASFDTWVACPTAGWCIEIYHEGELCFGRAGVRTE